MLSQGAMLQSLLAILAGVLILVVPRLLNYVVAGFFILFGLLNLPSSLNASAAQLLKSAVAIGAGAVILIYPRFLNHAVAFTLILLGVLGLVH
ncbi:MAG: DUF3096 domain-containing protein [Magnetococcales bacterium]|nr:DUF3096 domain-containing protein [Magnetococcales bacterium]